MTITVDLPADLEATLRERAARGDGEAVRRLLTEAVVPAVDATAEALLRDPSHEFGRRADGLTDAEFEALADQLAGMSPLPLLSDHAVSREGIYEDHP